MKSLALKKNSKKSHLKLVKNGFSKQQKLKGNGEKIYINTLIPTFNYIDNVGNLITPKKCALL